MTLYYILVMHREHTNSHVCILKMFQAGTHPSTIKMEIEDEVLKFSPSWSLQGYRQVTRKVFEDFLLEEV